MGEEAISAYGLPQMFRVPGMSYYLESVRHLYLYRHVSQASQRLSACVDSNPATQCLALESLSS